MTRPVCIQCNAVYAKRRTKDVMLVWHKNESRPPYLGKGTILKESDYATINDIERALGRPLQEGDQYVRLEIWDGETWWGGYDPFCTLRCALDYARNAYQQSKSKK